MEPLISTFKLHFFPQPIQKAAVWLWLKCFLCFVFLKSRCPWCYYLCATLSCCKETSKLQQSSSSFQKTLGNVYMFSQVFTSLITLKDIKNISCSAKSPLKLPENWTKSIIKLKRNIIIHKLRAVVTSTLPDIKNLVTIQINQWNRMGKSI